MPRRMPELVAHAVGRASGAGNRAARPRAAARSRRGCSGCAVPFPARSRRCRRRCAPSSARGCAPSGAGAARSARRAGRAHGRRPRGRVSAAPLRVGSTGVHPRVGWAWPVHGTLVILCRYRGVLDSAPANADRASPSSGRAYEFGPGGVYHPHRPTAFEAADTIHMNETLSTWLWIATLGGAGGAVSAWMARSTDHGRP